MGAMGKTSITLTEATRDDLRAAKVGGETYDETIQRLLEAIPPDVAESLIQEWRIAAADGRGDREASTAYREAAAELEHNLQRDIHSEADE
jgi:lipoate synthase